MGFHEYQRSQGREGVMSSLAFEQNRACLFFSSGEIALVLVDRTDGAGTECVCAEVQSGSGFDGKRFVPEDG